MDVFIFTCHKIINFALHLLNVFDKILLNY